MSLTHAGHPQSANRPNPFRQPKAVWAVAFACVISFMGIGLVDPILPSLAAKLQASRSQVETCFGTPRTLYGSLIVMAFVTLAIGIWPDHRWVVIGATVASGIFIGPSNTLVTTAVMSIAPVPRPVAAATYGFVWFIGGGLAPYVAGQLVEHYNAHVPFVLGAVTVAASALVLSTVHRALTAADGAETRPGPSHQRIDAEEAVLEIPGTPEEAVIADDALREDRALNNLPPR
jgi:MFS transporter, ACDE family, multidrug resistance protein